MICVACYHPLLGVYDGINVKSGKPHVSIHPYSDFAKADFERYGYRTTLIPCGQCIGCRLAYSRQWADRCMLELQSHESSYFVTLTYAPEHMPTVYVGPEDLERSKVGTLRKRDVQLFFKRLRKYSGQSLRYYGCGEYGGQTYRPHYHLIIFGLVLDDLRVYKRVDFGDDVCYNYYISDFLARCWGLGHVVVGRVTWDTCAYTARYMTKKLKGGESFLYSDLGVVPPFSLCSRRPGIGRDYYEEHKEDFLLYDETHIATDKGGRTIRTPAYYDRLFDIEAPEFMEARKAERQDRAQARMEMELAKTSLDLVDYLRVKEDSHTQRSKKLKRSEF